MSDRTPEQSAAHPGLPARILNWLRQGYPQGVPAHDTFALFYVLERELTEHDLNELLEMIISEGDETTLSSRPITRETIGRLIHKVHSQAPVDSDIDRISHRLAEAGFTVS